MNIKEAVEWLDGEFRRCRANPCVHLGLGDIKLSFRRQEEILSVLEQALREKANGKV